MALTQMAMWTPRNHRLTVLLNFISGHKHGYRLQVTGYGLQDTGYRLPDTDYILRLDLITGFHFRVLYGY